MKDVVSAWKDSSYRASLTPEELAALPPNPAGASWADADIDQVIQQVGADSDANAAPESGGYICTITTECPILTIICC